MERITIENYTFSGGLWVALWLFTIGYAHLNFVQSILGILLWPYYLGVYVSPLVGLTGT